MAHFDRTTMVGYKDRALSLSLSLSLSHSLPLNALWGPIIRPSRFASAGESDKQYLKAEEANSMATV